MKFAKYNKIVSCARQSLSSGESSEKLCELFPQENKYTLSSIYAHEVTRIVKRSYYKISDPGAMKEYYKVYSEAVEAGEPPGIILRMSKEIGFASGLLAKLLLEYHLSQTSQNEASNAVTKSQVNKLLRDTTKIEDRDLSYEIYLCLLGDEVYGPFADSIKHSIGYEHELLLLQKLDALNIAYHDEDILRTKGYDKTPDVKLDVPIAVDGHVINWIESKASFGDEDSHKSYLKDQFWSYWNRFGPGLVIYWFGFIDELDEHTEKGIIIRDDFPSNITLMDPGTISEKS